ncbi:hypothetical protein N657DRAFT_663657 [Parathielavia appendiculata]|uniref:Uncharacterized protein n=1 Tax=Parathielavia appendiculata TaxID=2587402 RepID=A0AAN6Z497_9PEZI|nr:hypothetical protein N657DRAFT_663657 [Parathielavia appendiculata]
MRSLPLFLLRAVLAYLLYAVGPSLRRRLTVLGALRRYPGAAAAKGEDGTLSTACEDNAETRFKWFRPLTNFDDPELPVKAEAPSIYDVAVRGKGPHTRSPLEIFHHVLGSTSTKRLRSVWHPLIRMSNDISAESPASIYWTEVVRVRLASLAASDPSAGVTTRVALFDVYNSNSLSYGRSEWEMVISSYTSGVLHIGPIPADANGSITVSKSVEIDHVADNPSCFADPYATPGDNRTKDPAAKDPFMITYVRPIASRWEKRGLFENDGTRLRSASAVVLVALEPTADSEKAVDTRKAWLFATGFLSRSIIAIKIRFRLLG